MLETHEPGGGQSAFKHRKQKSNSGGVCDASGGKGAASLCTSLFLQGEEATRLELSEVEGNLGCPKCGVRIGSFNWAGAQCSCGQWVCPAIQVTKSKVDEPAPPSALPTASQGLRGRMAAVRVS